MAYLSYALGGVGAIIAIGIFRYGYKTYNELIYHRMQTDKQSSNVEVHLKKKFDLIPALLEIVKGYTQHEKGLLTEVTHLRSQWGASKNHDEKIETSNLLESTLSKLLLIQERYPDIKADKGFRDVQYKINGVERELVHERKVYNKRVGYYNARVETFPNLIVAKIFGFKVRPFYKLNE